MANSLNRLAIDAESIMVKLLSGLKVTDDELEIIRTFNRLNSKGKAGNSGKRKSRKTGK